MIERGKDLGFALEAGEALRIGRHGLRQHLDRHLATKLRVIRTIDLTHAAFTQLGGDPKMRKRLADQSAGILTRGPQPVTIFQAALSGLTVPFPTASWLPCLLPTGRYEAF